MDINLIAPYTACTSYGLVATNLLKEIIRLGHSVSAFPIGGIDVQSQEDADILKPALERATLFSYNSDCIRLFHQFSLDQFVGRGRKIGFVIFELDRFNQRELHHLNYCDMVIVPSKWAKKVCEQNGVKSPVKVVPLGVDNSIFYPVSQKREHGPTRFLFCGKWEVRKACDVLLTCFEQAFRPCDDVELYLCSRNIVQPNEHLEWEALYKKSKLADKFKFVERLDNQYEVAELIRNCDIGLSPSRAEGFNLPLLEMMACGKPVITTDYAAHTEFARPENSCLIKIEETEEAYDGRYFMGGCGNWASFGQRQEAQLVHYMTKLYSDSQQQPKEFLINKNGIVTGQYFTWENSAKKLIEVLK